MGNKERLTIKLEFNIFVFTFDALPESVHRFFHVRSQVLLFLELREVFRMPDPNVLVQHFTDGKTLLTQAAPERLFPCVDCSVVLLGCCTENINLNVTFT